MRCLQWEGVERDQVRSCGHEERRRVLMSACLTCPLQDSMHWPSKANNFFRKSTGRWVDCFCRVHMQRVRRWMWCRRRWSPCSSYMARMRRQRPCSPSTRCSAAPEASCRVCSRGSAAACCAPSSEWLLARGWCNLTDLLFLQDEVSRSLQLYVGLLWPSSVCIFRISRALIG